MSDGKKPRVWQAFTQPAAWTMFFFGFASGLPFLLVAGTLAYWLKDNDIDLKSITLIASAGLSYTLKFVWAPLVDRWTLPVLGRLGLRRGWILLALLLVMGALRYGVVAMAAIGRHASRQANGRRRRVMGVQFRGKGRCIDSRRSTAWPPSAAAAAATQAGSGVGATNGTFTIPKLRIVSPPD